MKRSIATTTALILALCGLASGCSGPQAEPAQSAPDTAGWVLPPMVETVQRQRGSLVVAGRTAAAGRVVLRSSGAGATAYAASADDEGRFEVRIDVPSTDTLFVVEAQRGQAGVPAPYRMLVSADPSGPIALLSPGAVSRRLDPGPALDAIDGDGGVVIASGRAAAGQLLTVTWEGTVVETQADPSGHWSAPLNIPGGAPATVRVADQAFAFPGLTTVGSTDGRAKVERAGEGWRVHWSTAETTQVTWFPDRRP